MRGRGSQAEEERDIWGDGPALRVLKLKIQNMQIRGIGWVHNMSGFVGVDKGFRTVIVGE